MDIHGIWTPPPWISGHHPSNPPSSQPWTALDDENLKKAAAYWGVDFGDPWMYISADLDRPADECRNRWIEIYTQPKQKSDSCELVLSKCMRPLLMNRQFRMLPPTCYIVPTEANFPLVKTNFKVPDGFAGYRDKENFMRGGVRRGRG